MAYCTLDDLKAIMPENDLIQLTDDSIPATQINTYNAEKAISNTNELIDGYLRDRYVLPLSPVPGLINTLAVDITAWRLYARRVKLTPPEGVSERYRDALKTLELIRIGKLKLGIGEKETPGSTSDAAQITSQPPRIFSSETLHGY